MDVQDGFIVDVSSFCDRWCTRCALTARCELFVKNNSDARSTTADSRQSLLEQVEMMRDVTPAHPAQAPSHDTVCHLPADLEPSPMGPSPEVLRNSKVLHRKRQRARLSANAAVRLAVETIDHFTLLVPVKMLLCLGTVARDGPGPQQSDANGWGKAALLGLERMRVAWRLLVDTHHCSESDAAHFYPRSAACSVISSARCHMRERSSGLVSTKWRRSICWIQDFAGIEMASKICRGVYKEKAPAISRWGF